MINGSVQVFLSFSGEEAFEASLLQYAVEQLLKPISASVWTYQRDQSRGQSAVARSLKIEVQKSQALIFLVSPATISSGAAQWMELAYADAFDIPTFVLLHRITFAELRGRDRGVPPLLLASQCNPATDWKSVVDDLHSRLRPPTGAGG